LADVNKPKVTAENFIDFLVATPENATAMEAQRTNPVGPVDPSHDAYTRLLHRLEPSNDTLWPAVAKKIPPGDQPIQSRAELPPYGFRNVLAAVSKNGSVSPPNCCLSISLM
jgi:hypothetical protein